MVSRRAIHTRIWFGLAALSSRTLTHCRGLLVNTHTFLSAPNVNVNVNVNMNAPSRRKVFAPCHVFIQPTRTAATAAVTRTTRMRMTREDDQSTSTSTSTSSSLPSRRRVLTTAASLCLAETTWRQAVSTALADIDTSPTTTSSFTTTPVTTSILPPGTITRLRSGRAVIIPNWLSPELTTLLRKDNQSCFSNGHFTNFILSRNPNIKDKAANDRWIMPSFSRANSVGPFADPTTGNYSARMEFQSRMAAIKAELSHSPQLHRTTLTSDSVEPTHEMEYLRYGVGALLQRHTNEHHIELKRPNGSRLPRKPGATRRSVTWMVYLNDDWDVGVDGGELRLHERKGDVNVGVDGGVNAGVGVDNTGGFAGVGANGDDLQIGWLKATLSDGERPVFLDPFVPNSPENENCVLYVLDGNSDGNAGSGKSGESNTRRNLSKNTFANIALHLGGGDALSRKLMVDDPIDAQRFHLIDAPKSLISSVKLSNKGKDEGVDGGEKIRDVIPQAGTLVLFDSVSLPHEVLVTNKERFGIQGWFHEKLGYM